MLRRNYRRTRSDETDIRSATGEELTGAMTVSTGDCRPQTGTVSSGSAGTMVTTNRSGAGMTSSNGALTVEVLSAAGIAIDDDDGGGDCSVGGSPRMGHHHRQHDVHHHHHHHHHHDHQPVTPSVSCRSTPFRHNPSVGSTDTEMTSLDTRELWLPDSEPTPSTMSALHQFGAEMLRLSRGLEKVASPELKPPSPDRFR